ncbi:MAG: hypothetical protein LPK45_09070, partial [Bacteroidota bacterium]|nr:hypothetical protein [Bacteroidota bacterium]MDX5431234.1 hypothetical protein [Bacteroidota bacterium]MDX5469973.1 hypothetical protein [Bacteroidota bacterium]
MKKLIPLLAFLFPLFSLAQGVVNLDLTIHDAKKVPLRGANVVFVEQSSGARVEKVSDTRGKVLVILDQGKLWKLFINNLDMHRDIEMPEKGTMNRTMNLTYNPKYAAIKEAQSVDRFNFKWTEQTHTPRDVPQAGKALVMVKVRSRNGLPQKELNVHAIRSDQKTGWKAKTNANGVASFMLEVGSHYDFDVEDVLNITYVDIRQKEGLMLTLTVEYDAPNIAETHFGDTIVQHIFEEKTASGRALYKVKVNKAGSGFVPNETVYLQEIHGPRVYVAYTDKQGEAVFMLPLGKKYMVHFNFERDVDVIDLTHSFGYVNGGLELVYRPNPKLEHPEL